MANFIKPIHPYLIPAVFDVTYYPKNYNLEKIVLLLSYPKNLQKGDIIKYTDIRNTENIIKTNISIDLDIIKDFSEIRKENLKHLVENFNFYIAVFKLNKEEKTYVLVPDYYEKTGDYSVYINAFYDINKSFYELNVKANVYNLTESYTNKVKKYHLLLSVLKESQFSKMAIENKDNCICIILGENKDLRIFGDKIIIKDNDIEQIEKNTANDFKCLISLLYFKTRAYSTIGNKIKDLLSKFMSVDEYKNIDKIINYILKALGLNL